jgi:hypothetical protein
VGLGIDDPVWAPTVFTKNRDRLLTTEISRKAMAAILAHREVAPLLSDEHFSVDGALVKAWASMKSFQPKPGAAPPDDEGAGDPPSPDTTAADQPEQTQAETDPMPAPPANAAMLRSTSEASGGRTPPMPRPPIRTPGFTRRRPAPARCCASSAMP